MSAKPVMKRRLFDAIKNHAFSAKVCFLCGVRLTKRSRSEEHVFPLWLLAKFNLFNRRLNLLNRTEIPYRQLTVPCCISCNGKYLSTLEKRIELSLFHPNASGKCPSTRDLYLWVSKIFIGILYRELLLPANRADVSKGTILAPDVMESYRIAHFFLQSVRVPMRFHAFDSAFPASVFLFDAQQPKTLDAQFDFRDDIVHRSIFLRLGSKGILATLDSGAQQADVGRLFARYAKRLLHPIQLEELGAKLFYKATLMNRDPKILIGESKSRYDIMVMPLLGMSNKPVFDKWDMDTYAKYVATFTGYPLEAVNPKPGMVLSWLSNEKDEFTPIDIESHPWRDVP